ncbi:hypothetical protein [Flavobacterium frigoris]|uniref:Uncharacterized protein n=1 Tax=Flavobacterium frigoris TaxID=229204 RepID=A0A1H9S1D2_FLAFI|nr:hypothetical protein [Flavobacterium frigoris]SER78718.1 hypothetical protein SAMN05444355_1361 [Flavobacterium frigoris]
MKHIKVKADLNIEFVGKVVYANGEDVEIIPLQEKENNLKNELLEIIEYDNGKKYVSKLRSIERNGLKYLSRIPNPIFILLNSSIENYNKSEYYINKFSEYSEKVGERTYRLNNNDSGTSEVYNKYIECKMVSINSLINSLEIFMNQKIPNDYVFIKEIKNKKVKLNKKEIEKGTTFREKIEKIFPEIFPNKNNKQHLTDLENIFEAYSIRKDITHMKTNGNTIFEQYFEVIGKLIDSDIEKFIISSINFMNNIEPNLIEV